MNKAVIITARTNSSRLNGKILMKISKTLRAIDIIIMRAKKINVPIILTTTKNKSDDKLCAYVKNKYNIKIFRGENLNKLKRWYNCFIKFKIEKAAIIDGDDVFFDFESYKKNLNSTANYQILSAPKNMITGLFTHIITLEAMKQMKKLFSKDIDSEMIEPFLKKAKVKRRFLKPNKIFLNKKIRLTLDYVEDLILLRKIFKKLKIMSTSKQIVNFLIENKKISNFNYFREEYWKKNQTRKIKSLVI